MKTITSLKFILLMLSFHGMVYISLGQSLLWTTPQAWIPAYTQAKQVQQDNEFTGNTDDDGSDFYCNPLVLNGKMLDYNTFTLESRGMFAVVTGNPSSVKAGKIPFKVMIRREGKILSIIHVSDKERYEIEISKVLAIAKTGDQLIIDPLNPKDWKAKRILNLLSNNC